MDSMVHLYDSPVAALKAAAWAARVPPAIQHDKHGWSLWLGREHDDRMQTIVDGLELTGYKVTSQWAYTSRVSIPDGDTA